MGRTEKRTNWDHMIGRPSLTAHQASYAREFIAGVAGVPFANSAPDELLSEVFDELSRRAELGVAPDANGRYSWSAAAAGDAIRRPWLDLKILQQANGLRDGKWPNGGEFAVCLSHDMDHVTSFTTAEKARRTIRRCRSGRGNWLSFLRDARGVLRQGAGSLAKRLLRIQDQIVDPSVWLKLEGDAGFKSSLYFFAERLNPWHPFDCDYAFSDRVTFNGARCSVGEMIRQIGDAGWEIGIHGSIATATSREAFEDQKLQIERQGARPVVTTRQHFLQFHAADTPAIQEAAGVLCDTTMAFNDDVGFRSGTCHPYRCWNWRTGHPSTVFEIATQIQDGALFRHHPTVDSALKECGRIIAEVRKVRGCLGVLFHPWHLSTPRGLIVYRELLAELKSLGAWGGSCSQVISHWRALVHLGR